jgi:hypothetical protein
MNLDRGERNKRVLAAITDDGVTSEEVAKKIGMAWKTVRASIANLCEDGQVHRAKFSTKVVWYFRTKRAAEAFQRPLMVERPGVIVPPKVTTHFKAAAQVFTPKHVKVQQCPGFNGLGFAANPEPVIGGFRTLGVGRYLEETAG